MIEMFITRIYIYMMKIKNNTIFIRIFQIKCKKFLTIRILFLLAFFFSFISVQKIEKNFGKINRHANIYI
jgi:hypothetical protein